MLTVYQKYKKQQQQNANWTEQIPHFLRSLLYLLFQIVIKPLNISRFFLNEPKKKKKKRYTNQIVDLEDRYTPNFIRAHFKPFLMEQNRVYIIVTKNVIVCNYCTVSYCVCSDAEGSSGCAKAQKK